VTLNTTVYVVPAARAGYAATAGGAPVALVEGVARGDGGGAMKSGTGVAPPRSSGVKPGAGVAENPSEPAAVGTPVAPGIG